MLENLETGDVVAAVAETNPQVSYGADVISRIKAAENLENLAKITNDTRNCFNNLINKCFAIENISNQDIYELMIVENSSMEYLLKGISPKSLTYSPYVTVFNEIPPFLPTVIDLKINSAGKVILLLNIAGFVGADTVAAVIAVEQVLGDGMILMIDLGTNGEMVVGNRNHLVVCSTAAGLAYEGASC